jgi:DNA-binding transcriptional ArsR family regulator
VKHDKDTGAAAIDVDAMQEQASKASTLLSAMCNETRLMLLCQLIGTERSVNELARLLSAPQSTVSQHLHYCAGRASSAGAATARPISIHSRESKPAPSSRRCRRCIAIRSHWKTEP